MRVVGSTAVRGSHKRTSGGRLAYDRPACVGEPSFSSWPLRPVLRFRESPSAGSGGLLPPAPASPNADRTSDLYIAIFVVAAIAFLLVEGALVALVVRNRRRGADRRGHRRRRLGRPLAARLDARAGGRRRRTRGADVRAAARHHRRARCREPDVDHRRGAPVLLAVPLRRLEAAVLDQPAGRARRHGRPPRRSRRPRTTSSTAGGRRGSAARSTRCPAATTRRGSRRSPASTPSAAPSSAASSTRGWPAPSGSCRARSTTPSSTGASSSAALGKQEFEGVCQACHQLDKPLVGPALAGNSALTDRTRLADLVRNGFKSMPAVGSTWTDAQIDALYAYTKGLSGGQG